MGDTETTGDIIRAAGDVLELIGRTPLVRLDRLYRHRDVTVLGKLESRNPGGSVKDRVAVNMVDRAEREGLLRPGGHIVEPTSGNTGVGLALVAAIRGYRCTFTVPDKVAAEKIALLRAYGADVVICPTAVPPEHPDSYYSVARRITEGDPDAYQPNQYENPANPETHVLSTGPEIWGDTSGLVTHLIAGAGTGGTLGGIGRYLKAHKPGVLVVGADPVGSVYSGGNGDPYLVEGIGEDFWPGNWDAEIVDRVVTVADGDAFAWARRAAREEGLLLGGSCGAALAAADVVAADAPKGSVIVVVLPDSGRGYLSKLYSDDWMRRHGFLHDGEPGTNLRDALATLERPALLCVTVDADIAAAADLMGSHHVSVVALCTSEHPVVPSQVLGAVTARGILGRPAHSSAADTTAPLLQMGAEEPLARAARAVGGYVGVLVVDQGRPVGFLTPEEILAAGGLLQS